MMGWIKLHRELATKAIWRKSTKEQKLILVSILMMANHAPNQWEWKGNKFTVEPGQFVTSLNSIQEFVGTDVSKQSIRTALARFIKLNFLTQQSTKMGRVISIVNWELPAF
jgi:DNA replication protein DnaD